MILTEPSRRLLRRQGIMSPLLGVLLTAVGFMFMTVEGSSTGSAAASNLMFADILASLAPLYSGVFAGVALAIFNQTLLHNLDNAGVAVKTECEELVQDNGEDPVNDALADLAKVLHGITASAEKQIAGAVTLSEKRLRESSEAVVTAADTCKSIAAEYKTQRDAMQHASMNFQSSLENAAKGLVDISTSTQKAIQAVGADLGEASRLLQNSGKTVNDAVVRFDGSLTSFGQMTVKLGHCVNSLGESAGRFQESATAAMDGARQVGTRLQNELNEPIRLATKGLTEVCVGCHESTAKIKAAGDSLAESATSIKTGTSALQASASALSREVPALTENIKSIRESVTSQEKLLTSTPRKLGAVLEKFETTLMAHVKDSARRVGETVTQEIRTPIRESTEAITKVVDVCGANAERLARVSSSLDQSSTVVAGACQAVAQSSSNLSGRIKDVGETLETLAQTVTTHDEALKKTPHQLTEIIQSLRGALHTTEKGFVAAAEACDQSTRRLTTAGARFEKSSSTIEAGADGLRKTTDALAEQLPSLNQQCQSLAESIRDQRHVLTETPAQLVQLMEAVKHQLTQYIESSAEQLRASVPADVRQQLQPLVNDATAAVRGTTSDMQSRFAKGVESLELTGERLNQGSKSIVDGSRTISDTTTALTDRIRELDQTLDKFAAQLERVERQHRGEPDGLGKLMQSLEATLTQFARQQAETTRQQNDFYSSWTIERASSRKTSSSSGGERSDIVPERVTQSSSKGRNNHPVGVQSTAATYLESEETTDSKENGFFGFFRRK